MGVATVNVPYKEPCQEIASVAACVRFGTVLPSLCAPVLCLVLVLSFLSRSLASAAWPLKSRWSHAFVGCGNLVLSRSISAARPRVRGPGTTTFGQSSTQVSSSRLFTAIRDGVALLLVSANFRTFSQHICCPAAARPRVRKPSTKTRCGPPQLHGPGVDDSGSFGR